jgi:hypothetical protein
LETDGIRVSLNTEKPISSNSTKTQLHIEFVCGTALKQKKKECVKSEKLLQVLKK